MEEAKKIMKEFETERTEIKRRLKSEKKALAWNKYKNNKKDNANDANITKDKIVVMLDNANFGGWHEKMRNYKIDEKLLETTIIKTASSFERYFLSKKVKIPEKFQEAQPNVRETEISDDDQGLKFNSTEQESSSLQSEEVQNVTNIFMKYIQDANTGQPVQKEEKTKLLQDFNQRRVIKNINDISESDITISDKSESINCEKEQRIMHAIEKPLLIFNDKGKDIVAVIKSRVPIKENDFASNIVTFKKPALSAIEINRQLDNNLQKKKEELMRNEKKKYRNDESLKDPRDNFLAKVDLKFGKEREEQMKTDFRRYDEELEGMNSLVISMVDDENLIINEGHVPVFSEHNIIPMNDNFLVPQELIDQGSQVVDQYETKKNVAPNNTSEQFFKSKTSAQEKNLIKEISSPSKVTKAKSFIPDNKFVDIMEDIESLTKVHILNTRNQISALTKKQIKEDNFSLVEDSSKRRSNLMRRRSIDKAKLKYPTTIPTNIELNSPDKSNEDLNRKEVPEASCTILKEKTTAVKSGFRNYRENAAYFFNLIERDVFINDTFALNQHREDILNEEEKNTKEVRPVDLRDPIVAFNPSGIKIMKMSYLPYLKDILSQDDVVRYDHALDNFPDKVIDFIPIHNFSDRRRRVDDDLAATSATLKTFASSSTIKSLKSTISGTSMNSNTLMSRGTSISRSNLSSRVNFISDIACNSLDNVRYGLLARQFLDEVKLMPLKNNKHTSKKLLKEKQNQSDVKGEINKIRNYDSETLTKKNILCSRQDILNQDDDSSFYDEWNKQISSLENIGVILWKPQPFFKEMHILRYYFFRLATSELFDLFIILIVIINAIFMALDGNLLSPEEFQVLDNSKYVFNAFYFFELIVKLLGLGPILYFSELFSYLDVTIVSFALLEIVTGGNSGVDLSRLAFLRVFRIFRVLRLLKVLRKIKSVRKIISGISKAISQIYYILLILLIFIFIFQLIGMTLLKANASYNNFLSAFYVTFQLLTMENWNGNIVNLNATSEASIIYLILWIFFGNFVLFNLFLSILLESFVEEPYRGITFPKDYPESFKQIELQEEQKRLRIKQAKLKTGQDDSDITDSDEEAEEELISGTKTISEDKIIKKLFMGNQCENSLYILSQKGYIRCKLIKLANDKRFDNIILLVICLSTVRLIVETFTNSEFTIITNFYDFFDLSFNLIFIFECLIKILSMGFIMNKGTYLRDSWNKLDFFIVIISMFDMQQLASKYISSTASQGTSIGFLKVLRMLRILRPLRFISHNVQLKLMINSLLDSIQAIINVFLIVLVVFFIMSIVGITLFNNEFDQNCYDSSGNVISSFLNITQNININQSPSQYVRLVSLLYL